jgi:hypothetical protein
VEVQFGLRNLECFDPTTQEGSSFNKQVLSTSPKNKSQPHRTHLELGATAEPNQVNCLLCDLGGLLTKNTEQAMVQTSTSLWTDQKQVNERVGGRYSPSAGNRWPWID